MQTTTLSENLKTSTRPYHDAAEGSIFQSLLTAGSLPLSLYGSYLGQLFLVHDRLEKFIRDGEKADDRLSQVVAQVQYQVPFLRDDLSTLGLEPDTTKPLPATAKFLAVIDAAASKPISLLGIHYVLLGSKHGGKFIAKNLKVHYGFNGEGTRYFDPYGDMFMTHWRAFIASLNEISVAPDETDQILETAKQTFSAVGAIGKELEPNSGGR
jgi:heme oxygenase (biliverdin-producing, ferredoxin)